LFKDTSLFCSPQRRGGSDSSRKNYDSSGDSETVRARSKPWTTCNFAFTLG